MRARVAPVVTSVALVVGGVAACSSEPGTPGPAAPAPPPTTTSSSTPSTTVTPGPEVTFYRDVEPLLQRHCQGCHEKGGLAPFSLATYASAKPVASLLAAKTLARTMPPWGAIDTAECKPPHPWQKDARLTDAEIAVFQKWSQLGAPEGDPKDSRSRPVAPLDALPNKDLEVQPRTPFVAAGDRDQFRCFVLDSPVLEAGAYIGGIHVVPGNRNVVHHAVVFTDPGGALAKRAGADGSWDCSSSANAAMAGGGAEPGQQGVNLVVWTPGYLPVDLPKEIAMPVAKGAKLVMQIHYSPGGATAAPDTTRVQIRIARDWPDYLLFTTGIGNFPGPIGANGDGLQPGPNDRTSTPEFRVPANAEKHIERMVFTMPPPKPDASPIWVYGVMAHEHLAGVDLKFDLEKKGGASSCLLQDRWDFHWQRMYAYDAKVAALPRLEEGDKLKIRCTYDNTMKNPRLADEMIARHMSEPADIVLGEQTMNEMCIVVPQLLVKAPPKP